jgi:hypothetical protein
MIETDQMCRLVLFSVGLRYGLKIHFGSCRYWFENHLTNVQIAVRLLMSLFHQESFMTFHLKVFGCKDAISDWIRNLIYWPKQWFEGSRETGSKIKKNVFPVDRAESFCS